MLMQATRRQMLSLAAAAVIAPRTASAETLPPLVFAEFGPKPPDRGAYDQAIDKGADFLTAPIVAAKDGTFFVAPDLDLTGFTDVAARAEFADRRRPATIDGVSVTGWFAPDFTGPELRSLVTGPAGPTRSRAPPAPPGLLTLQDVIDIARAGSVRQARVVGVCPQLIHPAFFDAQDLAIESRLAGLIRLAGYDSAAAAMIVMSREPTAMRALAGASRVRRVQRIDAAGGPADPTAPRFQAMAQPDGLNLVRSWAGAVAPDDSLLIQPGGKGAFAVSGLIAAAHQARLAVFARASAAQDGGALRARLTALFLAGVDGVMCQDIGQAIRARGAAMDRLRPHD
jgi:glycerophosphoryl diester phosphodiesterase